MENTICTKSYQASIRAAKEGCHIDNSYPYHNDSFVKGFKSIEPKAQQSSWLKELWMSQFPDEYDENDLIRLERFNSLKN